MRPKNFLIALLAALTVTAVVPAWIYWVGTVDLPIQSQWLAELLLPALGLILIASWTRPELARPIVGVFVMAGVLAMAPQIWAIGGLASNRLAGDWGMARLVVQLMVPLLTLAFVVSLGWRRISDLTG